MEVWVYKKQTERKNISFFKNIIRFVRWQGHWAQKEWRGIIRCPKVSIISMNSTREAFIISSLGLNYPNASDRNALWPFSGREGDIYIHGSLCNHRLYSITGRGKLKNFMCWQCTQKIWDRILSLFHIFPRSILIIQEVVAYLNHFLVSFNEFVPFWKKHAERFFLFWKKIIRCRPVES